MGLASLGASPTELEQLAAVYWYTFEVGLCIEDNQRERKIIGGAVLSSLEESALALSSEAKVIRFDIAKITNEYYRKSM